MTNLRELADEWDALCASGSSRSRAVGEIGKRMAVALRAQADVADKVREGLSDDDIRNLRRQAVINLWHDVGIPKDKEEYFSIVFARTIGAHYASILAGNEELRSIISRSTTKE